NQCAKQWPLVLPGKAVQQQGIVAHHHVGEQADLATVCRQRIDGGHGRFQFVADAGHVQQTLGRLFVQQTAPQLSDHEDDSACRTPPVRAAVRMWWAWHSATAAASAASACSFSDVPSRTPIMCWIWAFSARPRPTMAFLICVGVYSLTGRPAAAPAQIAAPRA